MPVSTYALRLASTLAQTNAIIGSGSAGLERRRDPQPDGSAATLLKLVHTGLPLPAVEPHSAGWNHYLDRLTARASGSHPGPDPVAVNDQVE